MRIDLDKLQLGHSELTDNIYAGILNKAGNKWLQKTDVTDDFIGCVISRWEGHTETIVNGDHEWQISVRKIK